MELWIFVLTFFFPQLSLLSKGLTFIPSQYSQKNLALQSRNDVQDYHRRIKLIAHFNNKGTTQPKPFTQKSEWTPSSETLPVQINTLINEDLSYLQNNFKVVPNKPNLTQEETKALKELAQNKTIVIKPADKGSVTVIMDRENYLHEGYRQLNDKTYVFRYNSPSGQNY